MQRKSVPLVVKSADDESGTFTGLASVFDNVDSDGDIVRRGAFVKSLDSGTPVPLIWMHAATDPRNYVGDVIEATETDEGLQVIGKFDLGTEHGQAAYRNVKGRRVGALSIGYAIRNAVKTAAGNELTDLELVEVSIVSRGANDRALISSVKAADTTTPIAPIRRGLVRSAAARYLKEGPVMLMSDTKLEVLTKDRQSQLDLVASILDAADKLAQDLSAEDAAVVDAATAKIRDLDRRIADGKLDLAIQAKAREISDTGELMDLREGQAPPATTGHLAFSGKHAKALAGRIIKAMPKDQTGTKALAAGQQTTSVVMLPEVVPIGRPAVSVLDVLPSRITPPSYTFFRQSVRTLLAAPVAEGGTKPTSTVSGVGVENRLRTVAHVSEQINHYLLSDNVNLERFVEDELIFGLRRAVENQVLVGDGAGENFTGVLSTSGIASQVFATNALTSVRKALTVLDAAGYQAGVIVLSAGDWETIELLESTSGATDVRGVPVDPVARRLWGVPVVCNQALGSKVGLVIGAGAVVVDHDGSIDTKWSDAVGTDFQTNNVRCRVEGRFGVSVTQPGACVKVATAA
jgi:HK97 family phage major capsid protein/HK97 family phage prohead protease